MKMLDVETVTPTIDTNTGDLGLLVQSGGVLILLPITSEFTIWLGGVVFEHIARHADAGNIASDAIGKAKG